MSKASIVTIIVCLALSAWVWRETGRGDHE